MTPAPKEKPRFSNAPLAKLLQNRPNSLKISEGISISRRCKELFDPLYSIKVAKKAKEIDLLSKKAGKPFNRFSINQKMLLLKDLIGKQREDHNRRHRSSENDTKTIKDAIRGKQISINPSLKSKWKMQGIMDDNGKLHEIDPVKDTVAEIEGAIKRKRIYDV